MSTLDVWWFRANTEIVLLIYIKRRATRVGNGQKIKKKLQRQEWCFREG